MKNEWIYKMKSEINGLIGTALVLLTLGAVLKVTGTKFFGIDLLPFIIIVIAIALIIKGLQSDKKTLKWITNKLNYLFK
jgi:hypothetical protein